MRRFYTTTVILLTVFLVPTAATGQSQALTRIAFGPCANQNNPCPAWQQIGRQ